MRPLLRRLRHASPVRLDALLALAILVFTEAGVVFDPHVRSATSAVLAVPVAVAVLVRRRRPLAAVALALAAALLDAALEPHHLAVSTATLPAMLVLVFSLGRYAERREIAVGAGLLVACAALDAAYARDGFVNELAFDVLIVTVLPIVGAQVLRRRSELVDDLEAQRAQLVRERGARIRNAAAVERVRIARELHDVVVHDISAMVVQAAAARLVVHSRPAEAADAIGRVEGAGREALDELRRALGVLRADDGALVLQPQPSAARLPDLAAAAGAELRVEPGAALEELPADLQLTVYRLVQDILVDTPERLRHGTVRVFRADGAVLVEVSHDGAPSAGSALGPARRRATLFGGAIDTTPDADGRACVRARLPLPVGSR